MAHNLPRYAVQNAPVISCTNRDVEIGKCRSREHLRRKHPSKRLGLQKTPLFFASVRDAEVRLGTAQARTQTSISAEIWRSALERRRTPGEMRGNSLACAQMRSPRDQPNTRNCRCSRRNVRENLRTDLCVLRSGTAAGSARTLLLWYARIRAETGQESGLAGAEATLLRLARTRGPGPRKMSNRGSFAVQGLCSAPKLSLSQPHAFGFPQRPCPANICLDIQCEVTPYHAAARKVK